MKKLFFLLTFMHFIVYETYSQNETRIIPPSPNAASLGIFGEIPVSLYTGVPSISIPIYTIKSGDITVSLSLDYHASGIKVAQESSWVGLGWALNAGGVITRNVCGYDDFASFPTGFYYDQPLPCVGTNNDINPIYDNNCFNFYTSMPDNSSKLTQRI
jgi:hypothetical protein